MGVTVIRNLSSDKAPAETIEQLLEEGKYYRHPDSAQISYPLVVADQIGTLPTGKDLNVAIVGAGAAGLCALTELAKMKPANNKLTVTIFEADKDSFIHAAQRGISTAGKRAGRVFQPGPMMTPFMKLAPCAFRKSPGSLGIMPPMLLVRMAR